MNRVIPVVAAFAIVVAACSSGESALTTTAGAPADEEVAVTTTAPSAQTTAAQETTTTVAATDAGTLENPIPPGEFGQVGDWRIRVIDVTPDALEVVMEENEFADEPMEGDQFVMMTLEAQYTGTDSGLFWTDLTWKTVGPSAVAYEEGEAVCGIIPDPIQDAGEAFPGGVISGNVCWAVSVDDAPDLTLLLEPFFGVDATRVAYEVDPDMVPVDPLPPAQADLSTLPTVEIGQFAEVGDWNVSVVGVVPDALDIVLEENPDAYLPDEGKQFVMATLEAEYTGTESGTFWSDLSLYSIGPTSVAISDYDAGCGTIPDALDDLSEVFNGGVITGNVCWSVPVSDTKDLVMILEEFSMDQSGRTFFRLLGGE